MPFETRRQPDFDQFLKAITRKGRPSHLPFYEHLATPSFIARHMGVPFDRMSPEEPAYWRTYVGFWISLGYDCVPLEIGLNCPLPASHHDEGVVSSGSEERVCVRTMEDFEKYPWPDENRPIEYRYFEVAAQFLPEGAKIVGGVGAGPYEWASYFLGVVGMSLLLFDNPDLVRLVFEKIGSLHIAADRHLATMDFVGALRQGDDLGFKTQTFLKPETLRELVFPTYRRMARAAHEAGKPFILHSCGNLAEVYADIIDDCHVDAKHSFEEAIMPVEEFKRQYGNRCTPLGGLDVDVICRAGEKELRAYTRSKIDACFADGWWALGTGNSLTDYMPVENYLVVLDEGIRYTGG